MNKLRYLGALIVHMLRHAGISLRNRSGIFRFQATRGQGLVEYGLILVLIAIVTIGVLTQLGGQTSEIFSSVNCALEGNASATSSHPGNPQGGGGGLGNNTSTTGSC
jgi:pilus assembly protein Flp/PilA